MISLTQRPYLFTALSCSFAHPCVRDSDTAGRETRCAAAQVCAAEIFPTFANWSLLCVFLSKPLESLSMSLITWKGADGKCQKTTENHKIFLSFSLARLDTSTTGSTPKANQDPWEGYSVLAENTEFLVVSSVWRCEALGSPGGASSAVQWMPLLNTPQCSGQTPPPAGSLATRHSTSGTKTTSFAPCQLFANNQEPAGWILLPSY